MVRITLAAPYPKLAGVLARASGTASFSWAPAGAESPTMNARMRHTATVLSTKDCLRLEWDLGTSHLLVGVFSGTYRDGSHQRAVKPPQSERSMRSGRRQR